MSSPSLPQKLTAEAIDTAILVFTVFGAVAEAAHAEA